MKHNHLLGILGGVLFSLGMLTWWSFQPASPELRSGSPHGGPATVLNPVSQKQTPFAEQDWADAPRSQSPPAERPAETGLEQERRCLHLAERDPRAAVTLAIDTDAVDTHPGLLENLAGQWATRDFQAAHEWVLQQDPGEWRDGLIARVAFARSQSNPVAAVQVVLDEMSPGHQQTEAVISVLHQWALRDINGASAWARQFPEGAVRERALDEIEGIRSSLQAMATDARGQ